MTLLLQDAREQFFDDAHSRDGGICPCCDRFGKVYVRKFNKGMAVNLIYLYRYHCNHPGRGFVHLPSTAPRYILKDNQVGKLVFWGMAIPEPNEDDPTKNKTGCWRITDRGIEFVEGRIRVWSHVVEYNHNALRFQGRSDLSISDALGRRFDYQELMETAAEWASNR